MRVVGLDLGSRRIGVAVSDPTGTLATPHAVLARSGSPGRDHEAIKTVVGELAAARVVVGMPLSLSGARGPAATEALAEVGALAASLDVPVETFDERLTTVTAERQLGQAGVRGRARRKVVDQAAAAVMLQAWLDGRSREP